MTEFVSAPDVRFVGTEDGGMLLNLATGRFFGLNPTAAMVWRRLSVGDRPARIAAELAAGLPVTEEILLLDVQRLTDVLGGHGLLVAERGSP